MGVLLIAGLFGLMVGSQHAHACAFLRTPSAYEAEQGRSRYLATMDAASVDALLPGDPYFGLPRIEVGHRGRRVEGNRQVPAVLLKAIAWEESTLTMASRATRFESVGPVLISFDCGHGVMQVTTGMTSPLGIDGSPTFNQVNVATHYGYNIARGAAILAGKWNQAPEIRPLVGDDIASEPAVVENWYYAVWSYNGWVGPGSSSSNHPLDPSFGAWPRPRYQCDGMQSRHRYPYQELVWGCMAFPPERDGKRLWTPIQATLPNLTQAQFFEPLAIRNWVSPYSAMDLPVPRPVHVDVDPSVSDAFVDQIFAIPRLEMTQDTVVLRLNGLPTDSRASVRVENVGTGILSWIASSDESWIVVDPPAGVALGADIACVSPHCERLSELTITANPTLLPKAKSRGTLVLRGTDGAGSEQILTVEVDAAFEVAVPGTSRAY